jgi:histidine triad (HIT) family protein
LEEENLASTTKGQCIFCKIITGEIKSYKVYESDSSLVFLDHRPLLKGHCLLVPKKHFETLLDLPKELIAPIFSDVQLLAEAVEKGMEADGSFVAINTRISQSVPHLHVHIVPRCKNDHLFSSKMIWMRKPYENEAEAKSAQEKIKDAITEIAIRK